MPNENISVSTKEVMTHHASLLIGPGMQSFALLEPYVTPGPDIHHIIKDALAIDDVRGLIERAFRRPVVGTEVVFVVVARSINHEAQHALLKILEEPPAYVRVYLVVPNAEHLLPTVRSRMALVESDHDTNLEQGTTFSDFIALSYGERVTLIGEKTKVKDTDWIDSIITGAEIYAQANISKQSPVGQVAVLVSRYRSLRGASLKMLLEEIALTIPQR